MLHMWTSAFSGVLDKEDNPEDWCNWKQNPDVLIPKGSDLSSSLSISQRVITKQDKPQELGEVSGLRAGNTNQFLGRKEDIPLTRLQFIKAQEQTLFSPISVKL